MKIMVKEATDRKFRAKPSDRGVGGKWGPADTSDTVKADREQSSKDWQDNGVSDPVFQGMLKTAIKDENLPWDLDNSVTGTDIVSLWADTEAFGLEDLYKVHVDDQIDAGDAFRTEVRGVAAMLANVCDRIPFDKDNDDVEVGIRFVDNGIGIKIICLDIIYSDSLLEKHPSRKDVVDITMDPIRKVTAYLKKMVPVINKELNRQFAESKQEEKKLGQSDMKKLAAAINRGYIFEALDIAEEAAKTHLEEVTQAGEALAQCEAALASITMYKAKLDAIGATAVRKAIDYTYSEEGESAEKIMKTVKEAIKELYAQFGDLATAREMVSTFRSKYASNGTMSLNNGGNAVAVTRQELIDMGLDPNVSAYDYIARTTVTNKTKNAKLAEELAPIIENAKSLSTAVVAAGEKTIDVAEFEKLLGYLENLKKRSEETTQSITTRFFQATPAEIDTIPKESRMQEGILDTLKNLFRNVVDAVTEGVNKVLDFLFGMQDEVDEAGDAYDDLMATLTSMGYKVKVFKQEKHESISSMVAKISESVGIACDDLVKDASLDGEFVDEIIYTKEAFQDIADSLNKAVESLKALKGIATYHVNEGNMEIVGILADAITKIAADDSGEEEDDGSELPEELPQEVDRTYQGGEQEEPEEEEPPFGEGPEEF